ncbi:MAG: hypothetical protein ABMA13_06360 [Chthoniobacteraceae bacterium]
MIVPASAAQSSLAAGDLIFLMGQATAPDTIAFAPLKNISAGTVIFFSEAARIGTASSGWSDWRLSATGAFTEGVFIYVAPADIAAGTAVSLDVQALGDWGLALAGDNLFAFQGTPQAPEFLGALGWGSAAPFIATGTAVTADTYLPMTLASGVNAVAIANTNDNARYNGVASGTSAELLAAVSSAASWTSSNTALSSPGNLTVNDASDATLATSQLGGYWFGHNAAGYTTAPLTAPSHTTLSAFGVLQGQGTLTLAPTGGGGSITQDFQIGTGSTSGLSTSPTLDLANTPAVGFTLAIEAGYQLDLERLEFAYQRNANGPVQLALYVSNDGFASSFQLGTDLSLVGANIGVANFSDAGVNAFTGTLEFRFYAWGAVNATTSTFEIDEVYFKSSVMPVPEPGAGAILALGLGILALRRARLTPAAG